MSEMTKCGLCLSIWFGLQIGIVYLATPKEHCQQYKATDPNGVEFNAATVCRRDRWTLW